MRSRRRPIVPVVAAIVLACTAVHAGPIACGDADDSGTVTVTDGVQVLRFAAGLSSGCTSASERCDVDGDGTIGVSDGVNVLRAAAGLANACQGTFEQCGGVAGVVCPPGEECEDIPGDGCDPAAGGVDCGGICEPRSRAGCTDIGACPQPGAPCRVCADGGVACPIAFCDAETDQCRVTFQECDDS